MTISTSFLRMALGALAFASFAPCQYPGDAYFEPATLAIPASGQGSADLLFFSGNERMGALIAEVGFDPGQLEVVGVEALAADYAATLQWIRTSQGLRISLVRDTYKQGTIGSVRAVRITFRPLPGASPVQAVTSRPVEAVPRSVGVYASNRGYGLQIAIGSSLQLGAEGLGGAGEEAAEARALQATNWRDAGFLVVPLPLGGTAVLLRPGANGELHGQRIQTRNPGAASDAVGPPASGAQRRP